MAFVAVDLPFFPGGDFFSMGEGAGFTLPGACCWMGHRRRSARTAGPQCVPLEKQLPPRQVQTPVLLGGLAGGKASDSPTPAVPHPGICFQPLSPGCEGQLPLWEVTQATVAGQRAQGCFSTHARVIAAALQWELGHCGPST